jgi:CHASE3 domain sensor protein
LTLNEFLEEYDNLSPKRQYEGIGKALKIIASDADDSEIEEQLLDFLNGIADLEADDAFGTEGMDI